MSAEAPDETHCHADGHGPCVSSDCPIAGQGPLAGHLRPCPGAPGPQHAVATKNFPRAHLDRWVTAEPTPALSLPDFLLARIAEDEATIREEDELGETFSIPPHRMLADCEAKRRVVDYREAAAHESMVTGLPIFEARLSAYDAALRALALPYADHPDCREEWKP